jgi:hypothetical protein
MWKVTVEPDRPQMAIQCGAEEMRFALAEIIQTLTVVMLNAF